MTRGSAWIISIVLLGVGYSFARNSNSKALKVSIGPGKTPNSVSSRIENVSSKRQVFWSWYCSYEQEWKTDNKGIRLRGTACDKDGPSIQFLEPGEFRERDLALTVDPAIRKGTGVFRMAFVPVQLPDQVERANKSLLVLNDPSRKITATLKGPFWSNEIRIGSIPE